MTNLSWQRNNMQIRTCKMNARMCNETELKLNKMNLNFGSKLNQLELKWFKLWMLLTRKNWRHYALGGENVQWGNARNWLTSSWKHWNNLECLKVKQLETLRVELEIFNVGVLIDSNEHNGEISQCINAFNLMTCLQCCNRPRRQTSTILGIISFVCFLRRNLNHTYSMFMSCLLSLCFDNQDSNI